MRECKVYLIRESLREVAWTLLKEEERGGRKVVNRGN